MARKKRDGELQADVLEYIVEGLRPLAVPIAELVADSANARKHGRANLDMVKGSLRRFGQRAPIIVRRDGMVVIAGNCRLQAAQELAWRHIAAVLVDDDQATAIAFGITDNRTAETAEWDDDVLRQLLEQVEETDASLTQMFTDLADDRKLYVEAAATADAEADAASVDIDQKFLVVIECPDEQSQKKLLDELQGRELGGKPLVCKALLS